MIRLQFPGAEAIASELRRLANEWWDNESEQNRQIDLRRLSTWIVCANCSFVQMYMPVMMCRPSSASIPSPGQSHLASKSSGRFFKFRSTRLSKSFGCMPLSWCARSVVAV